VIKPSADYKYISFWVKGGEDCDKSSYGVSCLIDSVSTLLRELLQLRVRASASCKGGTTGAARVYVEGGVGPYSYRWMPGPYKGDAVSNLPPGFYTVQVTDARGKTARISAVVNEYALRTEALIQAASCFGTASGSIRLQAAGGAPPYQYSIDGGNTFSDSMQFDGLAAGRYTMMIKDANDCKVAMAEQEIVQPEQLQLLQPEISAVSCSDAEDGRLTLHATGGTAPYHYSIDGVGRGDDSIFQQLKPGTYSFIVTDDNNCEVTGAAAIDPQDRLCAVFMPNAFSPNGDGMNDIFRAKVHDAVSEFRLSVYGRWGQLIFETDNPQGGWDGSQKGQGLPAGSYLWVCTYTDSQQQAMKQTGTLVLVR